MKTAGQADRRFFYLYYEFLHETEKWVLIETRHIFMKHIIKSRAPKYPGGRILIKKQIIKIQKRTFETQQSPESVPYMGHKIKSNTIPGGANLIKQKYKHGGCGCGRNPKMS